jgi:Fe-Mn family superoxide dismutase
MWLNRRNLITGTATAAFAPRLSVAQTTPPPSAGPFQLPPLPYPVYALQPHVDILTMQLHHDRHHGAYVANLNTFAKDYPQIAAAPPAQVLAKLSELPDQIRVGVRNNLGGHVNHSMFWQIMGPSGGKPSAELADAIDRNLGGMDKMQNDLNAGGLRVFGAGWTFVTVTAEGKLALETRPNQDSVLMDGKGVLFGNDVWEHAYYLQYQYRRADYLKAWWNVVNWDKISERYAAAKTGTLDI